MIKIIHEKRDEGRFLWREQQTWVKDPVEANSLRKTFNPFDLHVVSLETAR